MERERNIDAREKYITFLTAALLVRYIIIIPFYRFETQVK